MALTYLLSPAPKWILLNNYGLPAGGASLYTYRSLNKTEKKAVYQDAGGTIPWSNPILFDLNGTQGPFYWVSDSLDPDETYYLEAYDAQGNLIWTMDNYFPPQGGGGGGGNTYTYIPIINYINNNQFIDHIDDTANPIAVTNLVIAPSNHKGFTPAEQNPVVGTYGVLGPDIRFVKNNTNATDQITFPLFALSSAPLIGDVTPVDYVRYQCTNSPTGETYKNFQFPITQKVKNLSAQPMTFGFWAAVTATPVNLSIYIRQYFGSGTAASPDTRTLVGTATLSTTWTWFAFNFSVPTVAGMSLGTPGQQTDDDAVYMQLELPLNAPCDVLFTKPALYLGTIDPNLDFITYDEINAVNSTARTGDIKTSYLATAPKGWVAMNDGSIGNVGSLATTRANQDTFQLYKTLWDNISDTWAPVSTGRGASAIADFIANKTLTLPRSLGRALAGYGTGSGLTSRALGEYLGSQTNTIVQHNLPNPILNNLGIASVVPGGGVTVFLNNNNLGSGILANPGGNQPINNMQPTSFMNVFIKL